MPLVYPSQCSILVNCNFFCTDMFHEWHSLCGNKMWRENRFSWRLLLHSFTRHGHVTVWTSLTHIHLKDFVKIALLYQSARSTQSPLLTIMLLCPRIITCRSEWQSSKAMQNINTGKSTNSIVQQIHSYLDFSSWNWLVFIFRALRAVYARFVLFLTVTCRLRNKIQDNNFY